MKRAVLVLAATSVLFHGGAAAGAQGSPAQVHQACLAEVESLYNERVQGCRANPRNSARCISAQDYVRENGRARCESQHERLGRADQRAAEASRGRGSTPSMSAGPGQARQTCLAEVESLYNERVQGCRANPRDSARCISAQDYIRENGRARCESQHERLERQRGRDIP